MDHSEGGKSGDQIPAVSKAVRLMLAVAEGAGSRSNNDLARALGIAPTTCFRLLRTLSAADWIRPAEGGGWQVSLGLLPVVEPLMALRQLVDAAREAMEQLARQTGLAVKLSSRQGNTQVTLHRVESPRPIAASGKVGVRFATFTGASGAALLSDLSPSRIEQLYASATGWERGPEAIEQVLQRVAHCSEQGWVTNSNAQALETLAAPVRGPGGAVLAALTLIGLRDDILPRADALAKVVLQAARQAEARLNSGDDPGAARG